MKKLILITLTCLLLILPNSTKSVKADDFCLDFWQLVEQTLVFAGGGCTAWDNTYHCTATGTEIVCREVICLGDPNPVTKQCF